MGFKCLYCDRFVGFNELIGTKHRNHCPFCLWSRHVDLDTEGDRKSTCQALMEPIGLTFKKIKADKFHPGEKGELMLVHRCVACGKISINRIATDDLPEAILAVFEESLNLDKDTRKKLTEEKIDLLTEQDSQEIKTQLFGRKG